MQLTPPPINALETVNIDHIYAPEQIRDDVFHYRPTYSYVVSIRRTTSGILARSTSEKTGAWELTEHVRQVAEERGIVEAFKDAFEWLEEQTRPR